MQTFKKNQNKLSIYFMNYISILFMSKRIFFEDEIFLMCINIFSHHSFCLIESRSADFFVISENEWEREKKYGIIKNYTPHEIYQE